MKQSANLLSIIALVAVGILYILFFTQNRKPKKDTKAPKQSEEVSTNIAFFNIDSVNAKVDYIQKNDESMKAKHKRMEDELNREGKKLQTRMQNFDKKLQEGKFSQVTAENEQKAILKAQEKLEKKNANFMQQMMKEKETVTEKLNTALEDALDEINAKTEFDYIFSYAEGGAIYQPNGDLDITKDVISKLNSKLK